MKKLTKLMITAGVAGTALIGFAAPANAATTDAVADVTINTPSDGSTVAKLPLSVQGTGEPGSSVIVYVDEAGRCDTTVNSVGWYVCGVSASDVDGAHSIRVAQLDAAGAVQSNARATVTYAADGTAPTRFTNTSSIGGPRPTFTGTGEPGTHIVLWIDGKGAMDTVIGPDGTWTMTPNADVTDGSHLIQVGDISGAVNGASMQVTVLATPVVNPAIAGGAGVLALIAAGAVVMVRRQRATA